MIGLTTRLPLEMSFTEMTLGRTVTQSDEATNSSVPIMASIVSTDVDRDVVGLEIDLQIAATDIVRPRQARSSGAWYRAEPNGRSGVRPLWRPDSSTSRSRTSRRDLRPV